jgi:proteasome assembly chaperone (PAC2) family protein
VLADYVGFELDYGDLEDRAEEMEEVVGKIQEMEQQAAMDVGSDDDLRYIG